MTDAVVIPAFHGRLASQRKQAERRPGGRSGPPYVTSHCEAARIGPPSCHYFAPGISSHTRAEARYFAARHQPFRRDLRGRADPRTRPSNRSRPTTAGNTPSRNRGRPGPSAVAKYDCVFAWEIFRHGVGDCTRSEPFRSANQARLESHAEHTVRDAHVRLPDMPE